MFLFPVQEGSTDDMWDRSSASLRVPSLWEGVLHDLANCMSWRGEEGVHTGFEEGVPKYGSWNPILQQLPASLPLSL